MTETPEDLPEPSELTDQLQPEDTLNDRGVDDILDEGYSPAERYSSAERFGSTAAEERQGESLDERMRQEIPEKDPYDIDDSEDDYLDDGEVGSVRAGRLVDPNEGSGEDVDKDLIGDDVGIDGAASSAEEAAIHIIED
ncbi:DUF5709 domain-containing protein [soil metagenome]